MHDDFNAGVWLLDRHIDEGNGARIALRCGGLSTTYTQLFNLTQRVSTGLRNLGVRPEERVAMVMLDTPEFVATFLGALRIGALPVLTNPLLPGRDLGRIVSDSRARVVVVSHEQAGSVAEILDGANEVSHVVSTGAESLASGPTWLTSLAPSRISATEPARS